MKDKVWLPLLVALAVVAGVVIGVYFDIPGPVGGGSNQDTREKKLRQIINYINYEYVDDVNTDSLLDLTLAHLLRNLDPHSAYIPQENVEATEQSIRGSFDGIGVEFKIYKDTLTIVRVLPDGPSAKAGLKGGYRILKADTNVLYGAGLGTSDVVGLLKGPGGSRVELELYDPLTNKIVKKSVKRGKVEIHSVSAYFMLSDTVGYVQLVRFSENTADEMDAAIKALKKSGAEKLVLDLRDNPGGLLTAAVSVSDQFLEDDKMVVFTISRTGERRELLASRKGRFEKGDVAVLINEGSASASEIVAGAIQDNDRGTIIGRRSFGKGLVQQEMELEDGSRIRLTTQRYYTPTGRSIQKPYNEYEKDYLQRKGYSNRIPKQDSAAVSQRKFVTPGGKVVYGGGGIMPDVVVHYDTSKQASLLYHLGMVVNIDQRAFEYVDAFRKKLQYYPPALFVDSFAVDSAVLGYFFPPESAAYLNDTSVRLDLVKSRIKAFIARNLYDNAVYQQIYLKTDPFLEETLRQWGKKNPETQALRDSI